MKLIQILKITLLLTSQIYKSSGRTYYQSQLNKRNDFIDDNSDLFTRECKFTMTDNLYIMKSCLEYLEGDTITEQELNQLCDSFQDYYAKEGNDDEDEEEDMEEVDEEEYNEEDEEENDLKELYLVGKGPGSHSIKNIPIINMSNITEEEAEVLYEVTKVINDFDKMKEVKKQNYEKQEKENDEKEEKDKKDKKDEKEEKDKKDKKDKKDEKEEKEEKDKKDKKNKKDEKDEKDEEDKKGEKDEKDEEDKKGEKDENSDSKKSSQIEFNSKMCHIYVKRWKEKCRDVSRIASIINTSLEIFYFRRESHCIRNQKNQYCSIVMNDIHRRAFNGSNSIVVPLNEQDRNNTCECYNENMTYLREEYNSSIDPTVERKHKPYSKSRNNSQNNSDKSSSNQTSSNTTEKLEEKQEKEKRTWESKEDDDDDDVKKENQNDQFSDLSKSSFINKIKYIAEMLMHQFSPSPSVGINPLHQYYRHKNIFPSYRKLMNQNNKNSNDNKESHDSNQPTSDFINELRRIFFRELQPNISLKLEEELYQHYQKRMESDVNVQQLKKLINHYHNDMSQYMDLATCNVTFKESQTKNSISSSGVNGSHSLYYYLTLIIITILLSQFIFYYLS